MRPVGSIPRPARRIASADGRDRYQDVFGQTLVDLARLDRRVVGITPAMPSGCSMNLLLRTMPERCFDVGIAEGHAVTFSAGLAAAGIVPFCNIYSTFMQRAFDNVIHDVAIQRLPVVLCLDRGGLVGEDGATHHGAFDLAYFGCIPNLTVASPLDERELRNLLYTALQSGVPFVVRYPRGKGEGGGMARRGLRAVADRPRPPADGGRRHGRADDRAGKGNVAARAVKRAAAEGVSAAHYDLRFARPLDEGCSTRVGASLRAGRDRRRRRGAGRRGERRARLFSTGAVTVRRYVRSVFPTTGSWNTVRRRSCMRSADSTRRESCGRFWSAE